MQRPDPPAATERWEVRLILPAHFTMAQADAVAARMLDETPSWFGVERVRREGDACEIDVHREVDDDDA